MRLQGIVAGAILGILLAVPALQSKAQVIDSSVIRASLVKAGVIAASIVGNPFGEATTAFFKTFSYTIVPETTETITTSFTRATPTSVLTAEAINQQLISGEAGFAGAERYHNLSQLSDTSSLAVSSTDTLNVTAGTYVFSMGAGTGTATFSGTATGATGTLTANASSRTAKTLTITGTGTLIVTASVAALTDIMWERKDGPNKNPGPYTSIGVESSPFHGAGVDGIRYQNTFNGNTVSSNVVTEATGAAISNTTASFANLNGSGNYYSQADSAANSFTESLIVWAYIAPEDVASGSTQEIVRKTNSYIFRLTSIGTLGFIVYDSSTFYQTFQSVSLVDGEGGWVGGYFNHSAQTIELFSAPLNHTATFSELEAEKVSLGAAASVAANSIDDTANSLNIGHSATGLVGRNYKTYLASDTSGTGLITFDPNDTTGWTANGNAYISTPPLNPDGDGPAGLQVAAAGTNQMPYSGALDNAAWQKTNVTIDADAGVSFDGTTTMDRVNVTAGNGIHLVFDASSITGLSTATDYTWSGHLKDDGSGFSALVVYFDSTDWAVVVFNHNTGAVTQSSTGAGTTSITDSGVVRLPNGILRGWMTVQDSANTTAQCWTMAVSTGTPTLSATDGSETWNPAGGEDYFAGGFQFEQGKLGPYVSTDASAVARNASINTDSGFTLTTNSGHITVSDIGAVDGETYVRIDDGTANNYVRAYLNGSAQVQLDVVSGGVSQAAMTSTTTFTAGDDVEIAWRVAEDDMALLVDGSVEATDSSGSVPATMDDVDIGHNAGTVVGTRNIGSLQLFDTAKSNVELSAL